MAFKNTYAQTTITGIVSDLVTGKPIPDASIKNIATGEVVKTSKKGEYSIEINQDSTILRFSADRFFTEERVINLTDNIFLI